MTKWLVTLVLIVFSSGVVAQRLSERLSYLEVGLFVHSVGTPFIGEDFLDLDHPPGFFASTSFPIRVRDKWQTDYKLLLAGYHQRDLHYGFQLDNQITQSFKPGKILTLEAPVGLGYLHTFDDAPTYSIDGSQYKPRRDWGKPQLTLSVGIGFVIQLGRSSPLSLFVQQQVVVVVPYAPKSGIPLFTHSRTYLGIRRTIN